jgi:hypothetical protein
MAQKRTAERPTILVLLILWFPVGSVMMSREVGRHDGQDSLTVRRLTAVDSSGGA